MTVEQSIGHPTSDVGGGPRRLRWLWSARALPVLALLCGVGGAGDRAGAQPPGRGSPEFDRDLQAAAVDSISTSLDRVYIFADVAARMSALLRANLEAGAYDSLTDPDAFAERITLDLRSVSHDLHLRVFAIAPEDAEPVSEVETDREERFEEERRARARTNFGFTKLEILSGNVGYLRLDRFDPAELGGDVAVAAMNYFANCSALIIDLRRNGGGSPSMIQLLTSYFLAGPTHLNSFFVRSTDETQQFWTTAHVDGPRLDRTPLYVLTSGRTFSAAEEFTYNLKNLERATIVGETTGGGAHPVQMHTFAYVNLAMSLPFGRAINPISGTNWEGTGVVPDIDVPAGQALDQALLVALTRLRETTDDEEKRAGLDWGLAELESRMHPFSLPEKSLHRYVGEYGERRVTREGKTLWYQRGTGPRIRMIPMSESRLRLEEIDGFRFDVEFGKDGIASALVGQFEDGRRDRSPRTGD